MYRHGDCILAMNIGWSWFSYLFQLLRAAVVYSAPIPIPNTVVLVTRNVLAILAGVASWRELTNLH